MRFKAPTDTSAVSLTVGEFAVDQDGFVEIPDDLSIGDLNGLAANGFVAAPAAEPAVEAAPRAKKA